MARTRGYQFDYSKILPEAMYDREAREKKAATIVAVFKDYFKADLKSFSVLDVGCSTGFITNYLSNFFGRVLGIDIDEPAIDFAKRQFGKDNLEFVKSDSQKMEFSENTFDAVICAHIYEHVPDASRLLGEIFRVLKPGGVCYFAAGNRINVMESHYNLPFLSMLPRPLAHIYVRASRKSKFYYEKHLTYWSLKRLVCKFERIDYTKKIIQQPESFEADYMLRPNTHKARLAQLIVKRAYWLCPTFIWLLRKP
ncbi:MAG: class I SAM-dependent methyltransferase [Desulfobacterales bacterium]|nr:MAG: class I SAM-dependent methyltransferase [Desulfobacterales bacterium]